MLNLAQDMCFVNKILLEHKKLSLFVYLLFTAASKRQMH